mgnify:CR=1 FL=1
MDQKRTRSPVHPSFSVFFMNLKNTKNNGRLGADSTTYALIAMFLCPNVCIMKENSSLRRNEDLTCEGLELSFQARRMAVEIEEMARALDRQVVERQ